MHVPRFWARAEGEVERAGVTVPLAAWGWSDDAAAAQRTAAHRLARFSEWCRRYERASEHHATCRFLEDVGRGTVAPRLETLVRFHDEATRCTADLPLA